MNKLNNPDAHPAWLVFGACAGLFAAGYGLLTQQNETGELPVASAARVNDTLISNEMYMRALQRLQNDSKDALEETDRDWVLQRLIDEELLVQRGLSLGMAQSETNVRSAIVQSLIASITAEADAEQPSDAVLESYYEDHGDLFTGTTTVMLRVWVSDSEAPARQFLETIEQDPGALVSGAQPTDDVRPFARLPQAPLPLTKLRDYLGPTLTSLVANQTSGTTLLHQQNERWYVVQVQDKQTSETPAFNGIRTRVLNAYRRNLADQALRDYLEQLERDADVLIAQP